MVGGFQDHAHHARIAKRKAAKKSPLRVEESHVPICCCYNPVAVDETKGI